MINDFIGKIFNDMLVLELDHITKNHVKIYKVRCIKCGHGETTKHSNKGCGIYLKDYDENIGKIYNDITIIDLYEITKDGYKYITECNICGHKNYNLISNIKRGHSTTHEHCSRSIEKDEFIKRFRKIYFCMRYRTTNPNYNEYYLYGGRGISSEYFKDFMVFYKEMYESYVEHVKEFGEKDTTLDRIDVDGNYETSNCRWATYKEQRCNQRRNKKDQES